MRKKYRILFSLVNLQKSKLSENEMMKWTADDVKAASSTEFVSNV